MESSSTINRALCSLVLIGTIVLIAGCSKGSAAWRVSYYSPSSFNKEPAKSYMLSMIVAWENGRFDEVGPKRIKLQVYGPELGKYKERVNLIREVAFQVNCGKVSLMEGDVQWKGSDITIGIACLDPNGSIRKMTKVISIPSKE